MRLLERDEDYQDEVTPLADYFEVFKPATRPPMRPEIFDLARSYNALFSMVHNRKFNTYKLKADRSTWTLLWRLLEPTVMLK